MNTFVRETGSYGRSEIGRVQAEQEREHAEGMTSSSCPLVLVPSRVLEERAKDLATGL
jgi:hypothetical protein